MIGDAKSIFLDTNILIYANTVGSPLREHSQQALKQYSDAGSVLNISRQVMREYLAALTRTQGPIAPVPVASLIPDIRQFEAEYQVVEDGPQVTERLLDLLSNTEVGGKQIHDANIVATMLTYGITHILTHNTSDFSRFSDIITVLPLKQDR